MCMLQKVRAAFADQGIGFHAPKLVIERVGPIPPPPFR
jgi:hypothetical protein